MVHRQFTGILGFGIFTLSVTPASVALHNQRTTADSSAAQELGRSLAGPEFKAVRNLHGDEDDNEGN